MAIQLDPLHMLRAINCPKPSTDVVVENWAQINMTNLTSENLCFTCAPPPLTCVFRTGYQADPFHPIAQKRLSAPFVSCEQFDMTVTGRTSGVSIYLGGGTQKSTFGLTLDECVYRDCWYQLDDDNWRRCYGSDNQVPFVYFRAFNLKDFGTFGLTQFEWIDLSFPAAPTKPITSITQKDANTIYVDCVNHQLQIASYLTIAGTNLYDGDWDLNTVESVDQFTISTPYIGDDSGGTVQANYLKNY